LRAQHQSKIALGLSVIGLHGLRRLSWSRTAMAFLVPAAILTVLIGVVAVIASFLDGLLHLELKF
jgi:hypothetical protein